MCPVIGVDALSLINFGLSSYRNSLPNLGVVIDNFNRLRNEFDGSARFPLTEVRKALTLAEHVPVINIDARDRRSATDALIAVSEYALASLTQTA